MERLQDIVTTRRRKMAGHVLRVQRERPAGALSMKTSKRWALAGMELVFFFKAAPWSARVILRRSDVSVDTVHLSLPRSFSSPRWYHLQSF